MKIMTILGTRPEIIRLSIIIKKLDEYCEHILVHTGQNYARSLNEIFFQDLEVRSPDYFLGIKQESFGKQIGKILVESEEVMLKERPDALLILGDTNSGLASIIAKRLGIKVYHMEAGNRCYDDRVPEEVNRRIIDHCSSILMPYTHRSKENLLREGIERDRIYVIGNPIFEVINRYEEKIKKSQILNSLKIKEKQFFLVTMHRAENVDIKKRLANIMKGLNLLNRYYKLPIVCSVHPRTKSKLGEFGIYPENPNIRLLTPLGFFDFVALEKSAFCVITDSGTVQEECCILHVSNITIRDVTERPETIECGSNILTSVDPEIIKRSVGIVQERGCNWAVPDEYMKANVSNTVIRIVLGYSLQK